MTQQRKTRPTRAARARLKTRTPNIPEFTGPEDWDRPAPAPVRPEPAAAGPAMALRMPASAFARAARSTASEVTQDYSYLRADLVRIAWTSTLLLFLMATYAVWYHFG